MASLSIYDQSLYMSKIDGYTDHLASEFIVELKALPINKYLNVSDEFMDAIAYEEFETEELWWVLALYNDVIDPMNPGTIVCKIPLLYDIESLMLKYRT